MARENEARTVQAVSPSRARIRITDDLQEEHGCIMSMLRVLESISAKMEEGAHVPRADLVASVRFLTVFVDDCHHEKEEGILFTAMDSMAVRLRGVQKDLAMTQHREIRMILRQLKEAYEKYTPGVAGSSALVSSLTRQFVCLVERHIAMEEECLFPIADGVIERDEQDKLAAASKSLERERIGPKGRSDLRGTLERLRMNHSPPQTLAGAEPGQKRT